MGWNFPRRYPLSGTSLAVESPASLRLHPEGLGVAGPDYRFVKSASEQPTSRYCSVDESVARVIVADKHVPDTPMGFVFSPSPALLRFPEGISPAASDFNENM